MKRFFILFLFIFTPLFSSTANAYLSEGTWSSDFGNIELATWSLTYGSPTVAEINSFTGQYQATGALVAAGPLGSIYTIGDKTYHPMYANYDGMFEFNFVDGINHIASATLVSNFTYIFDSSTNIFLGYYGPIEQYCSGLINDNGADYLLSGHLITNQISRLPGSENGVYDFVEFKVTAVPIPSAIWLFSSGLIFLLRKKQFLTSPKNA